MSGRLLIVNADDFNTDPGRNLGILEAACRGIVTSATALANLPWEAGTASALQARLGAGVGVHLNLTRGAPLTAGAGTLVDGEGRFLDKPRAWRKALQRGYDPEEVELEFAAQIGRLLDLGIVPSHIDGNNHIHVFPGMAAVVVRLAGRFGIGRVRLPRERRWKGQGSGTVKSRFLGLLSGRAARVFRDGGMVFPDHFAGIDFPRPGRPEELRELLERLPEGATELMCHPGRRAGGVSAPFSTREREAELSALTHPGVLERVRESGVRLISFADLPDGRP